MWCAQKSAMHSSTRTITSWGFWAIRCRAKMSAPSDSLVAISRSCGGSLAPKAVALVPAAASREASRTPWITMRTVASICSRSCQRPPRWRHSSMRSSSSVSSWHARGQSCMPRSFVATQSRTDSAASAPRASSPQPRSRWYSSTTARAGSEAEKKSIRLRPSCVCESSLASKSAAACNQPTIGARVHRAPRARQPLAACRTHRIAACRPGAGACPRPAGGAAHRGRAAWHTRW